MHLSAALNHSLLLLAVVATVHSGYDWPSLQEHGVLVCTGAAFGRARIGRRVWSARL